MTLYRFYEIKWSDQRLGLITAEFEVTKQTDQGAWIDYYGDKKFVKLTAKRRFACPTKKEAMESYIARKMRQVRILKHQLAAAEAALKLSESNPTIYFGDVI